MLPSWFIFVVVAVGISALLYLAWLDTFGGDE